MSKWGVRSMVWYVFILLIAFLVALFYYLRFINEPAIRSLFIY